MNRTHCFRLLFVLFVTGCSASLPYSDPTSAAAEESSGTGWQACRMNGLGVFASKGLAKSFFLEAGLDTYFTDSFPTGGAMGSYDTPIDRSSALMTVAAGARFYTDSLISPYIQIGLGAELTHVHEVHPGGVGAQGRLHAVQ